MVTVQEAESIIQAHAKDYGTEQIALDSAMGRIIAEDLHADRDLPPCNRATMDGIAISYAALEKGIPAFRIAGMIAAGDVPMQMAGDDECVEVMTGGAVPDSADTVIRYEDITLSNGTARIHATPVKKGQNIHRKGKDKKQGDVVACAGTVVDAALVSMAASTGKNILTVHRLPGTVILSTGDELVAVTAQPNDYQIRGSNSYTIRAALQAHGLHPQAMHLPDDPATIKETVKECLGKYDVIIITGGVSMGRYDHVPHALEELHTEKLFHKVQQRPGKPFWFGKHPGGALVFAFPGNPVSTFLCLHRYFIPWLLQCSTSKSQIPNPKSGVPGAKYAILDRDVTFTPALQYFVQVKLHMNETGQLLGTPVEGNGSGDFANLLDTGAFMELPLEQSNFKQGEAYRIWPFKQFI